MSSSDMVDGVGCGEEWIGLLGFAAAWDEGGAFRFSKVKKVLSRGMKKGGSAVVSCDGAVEEELGCGASGTDECRKVGP